MDCLKKFVCFEIGAFFHSPVQWVKKRANFKTNDFFQAIQQFLYCLYSNFQKVGKKLIVTHHTSAAFPRMKWSTAAAYKTEYYRLWKNKVIKMIWLAYRTLKGACKRKKLLFGFKNWKTVTVCLMLHIKIYLTKVIHKMTFKSCQNWKKIVLIRCAYWKEQWGLSSGPET